MTRNIPFTVPSNVTGQESLPDPDKFGYHNGYRKIERGWLTDETVIQFKLFNNPIKLWKNRIQNKKVQIKVRLVYSPNFIIIKKGKKSRYYIFLDDPSKLGKA